MLPRISVTLWVLLATFASWATAQIPVRGVPIPAWHGSAVPLRRNINALYSAGGPQWDLYITALDDLYRQNSDSSASFFQIAGVHGRPFTEYNRAGRRTGDGWLGYCPHGENLFLPWHRPYLVLFEQRLYEVALRLARTYPPHHRETYERAAQTLRAPFWDWASDIAVPAATVPTKLRVRVPTPDGKFTMMKEFDNPLRIYKFPQAAIDQRYGSFSRDAQIFKCRAPNSYPNSANEAMRRRSYKQWVYDAFTRSNTFEQFASTGNSGVSLEQIHNAVHWDGSCGFQFLNADYSAFDPLFMLHHANVDRLWAYWQFIRPGEATLTRSYRGQSRFSSPTNALITANSPLQPFFRDGSNFHTSDSVKSIRSFRYSYEGLEYWRKSDAQMRTDATAIINRLYATGAVRPMLRKRNSEEDQTTRYFAEVKVNVEELERPCEIGVYANATNVGNFIVMGQPATGTFFGKFALDKAADPEELKDEESRVVVGDLLASLRVEIKKHDGTIIPLSDVPSFKIDLENVDVLPPESDTELPEYHDAEQRVAPKKGLRPESS